MPTNGRALPQEREERGLALRLQREPHDGRHTGALEGAPQELRLLAGALEVVDEQRRAVFSRELLRVTARDRQPAPTVLQSLAGPPRSRLHGCVWHPHRLAAVRPAVAGFA